MVGGPQWLYVARLAEFPSSTGLYKIGRSVAPQDRLQVLQSANNEQYELVAQAWSPEGPLAEQKVHRLLAKYRRYRPGVKGGTEWFRCDLSIIRSAVLKVLPQFQDQTRLDPAAI